MNLTEVKIWNCNGERAIAVNTYPVGSVNPENVHFEPFNEWRLKLDNQPLTTLTGVYESDRVDVVELWEFKGPNSDKWKPVLPECYKRFNNDFEAYTEICHQEDFDTILTHHLILKDKGEKEEVKHYKGESFYKQYTGDILDIFYHRFFIEYTGNASESDKKEAFYEWLNEQIKLNNL